MKEIQLTRGETAIVDDGDFESLNKHKWSVQEGKYSLYAARREVIEGRSTYIAMHREIMGLSYGDVRLIDHINLNGLDNRRSNLRIADKSLNARNGRLRVNNKSGYRGVSWSKRSGKWRAQISVSGHHREIGLYSSLEEAGIAYKQSCKKYLGNDLVLNFLSLKEQTEGGGT